MKQVKYSSAGRSTVERLPGIKENRRKKGFADFSAIVLKNSTKLADSSTVFLMALFIFLACAVLKPVFYLPDAWQSIINSRIAIALLLVVSLIQQLQNDLRTVRFSFNALPAAKERPGNHLKIIKDLSKDEREGAKKMCFSFSTRANKQNKPESSQAVDKVQDVHVFTRHLYKGEALQKQ